MKNIWKTSDTLGMKEQIKKRYETILSLLKPHGPITGRAMFGGYGFYYDKVIFGILVGQILTRYANMLQRAERGKARSKRERSE